MLRVVSLLHAFLVHLVLRLLLLLHGFLHGLLLLLLGVRRSGVFLVSGIVGSRADRKGGAQAANSQAESGSESVHESPRNDLAGTILPETVPRLMQSLVTYPARPVRSEACCQPLISRSGV